MAFVSCITANSSLQGGRVLKNGETSKGVSLSFYAEYEEGVIERRSDKDLGSNYNPFENSPHFGLDLFAAHGLGHGFEVNGFTGLGMTAINGKYSLFSGEQYALSTGLGAMFPTLSWDYIETYIGTFALYNSYDFLENLSIYANPIFFYDPGVYRDSLKTGASLGLVFGKSNGLILEWSIYETVRSNVRTSVEHFNIGLVSNLNGLDGRNSVTFDDNFSIVPVLGLEVTPYVTLGLRVDADKSQEESWELETHLGVTSFPEKVRGTSEGYSSVNVYSIGRTIGVGEFWLKPGIARRELFSKDLSDLGWHRVAVKTNGVMVELRSRCYGLMVDWIGLYLPLTFAGTESEFREPDGDSYQPDARERRLARYFRNLPSISLLKTTVQL